MGNFIGRWRVPFLYAFIQYFNSFSGKDLVPERLIFKALFGGRNPKSEVRSALQELITSLNRMRLAVPSRMRLDPISESWLELIRKC